MQHVLVAGCGYSGARLALHHHARGDRVTGATRDALRHAELAAAGIALEQNIAALPAVQRVYYTVPPPDDGVTDTRLARFLAVLVPPRVLIYFSTTGVYGDCNGGRVDETAPPAPATGRARRRLDAEQQVFAWCATNGCRPVVLRIAAIYGPGRLPVERIRAGEPVPHPETSGPGNRIHVDDLVRAAVAIADGGGAGIWNISDGNPLSVAEFQDRVADAAGLPRPRRVPLDTSELSAGLRSFLIERRRVDNTKLLNVSGFQLAYPDPADGVRASIIE